MAAYRRSTRRSDHDTARTSSWTLSTSTPTRRAAPSKPTRSSSTQSRTACPSSATDVLLLELYHVVWHFNPIVRGGGQPHPRRARGGPLLPLRAHARGGGPRGVGAERPRSGRRGAAEQSIDHSPLAHMLALNGYNYWAADRRHPCSVLGMMYALEVIASVYGGPFASAIKESLLLRGRAWRLVHQLARDDGRRAHGRAAHDPQHARRRAIARERSSNRRSSTSITSRASSKPV